MKAFSDRLKQLRGDRTQKEVSDAIGITMVSLSRYETGKRIPDIQMLYKLCVYYNVSSDYLLGIDNNLSDYENLKTKNKQLEEKIGQIKQIAESER